MFYHFDRPDPRVSPNPFKACVVPRPIGWISTLSAAGVPNLAPFSFFNAIGESPPLVMFCANGQHVDGGEKDSLRNARETGEFVVNLATWTLRDAVNRSSAAVGRGVDEFQLAGLTPAPSLRVGPARVSESPVSLECVVSDIYDQPFDPSQELGCMVIGRVLGMHLADDILIDGRVSIGRLQPIARLGYREYAAVERIFTMARPGAKP
jgi:flavin reductase (DIM6/NTAB) family NADH-FMN oxidoreductase RutF